MSLVKQKKIALLIDDNAIDNFINDKIIKDTGDFSTVYIFNYADSALDFLKNLFKLGDAATPILPDCIFLDINMPIMDGYQFLDEYKKVTNPTNKNPKIIILTSSLSDVDKEKSNKYTLVSGFIVKPLSKEEIQRVIA